MDTGLYPVGAAPDEDAVFGGGVVVIGGEVAVIGDAVVGDVEEDDVVNMQEPEPVCDI